MDALIDAARFINNLPDGKQEAAIDAFLRELSLSNLNVARTRIELVERSHVEVSKKAATLINGEVTARPKCKQNCSQDVDIEDDFGGLTDDGSISLSDEVNVNSDLESELKEVRSPKIKSVNEIIITDPKLQCEAKVHIAPLPNKVLGLEELKTSEWDDTSRACDLETFEKLKENGAAVQENFLKNLKRRKTVHSVVFDDTSSETASETFDAETHTTTTRRHLLRSAGNSNLASEQEKRTLFDEETSDEEDTGEECTNPKKEVNSNDQENVKPPRRKQPARKTKANSEDSFKGDTSESDDDSMASSFGSVAYGSSGEENAGPSTRKPPKRTKAQKTKASAKTRRKRVVVTLSSDENGSDEPKPESRKKIRKVMTEEELEKETRAAGKEEKERRTRIAERQRLYNEVIQTESTETGVRNGAGQRVVLEFSDAKEPLVEVHPQVAELLKPHQIKGLRFLYLAVVESVDALKGPGTGAILAHSMGLGKTLQIVAFVHSLFSNVQTNAHLKTALIVVPINTTRNWAAEFNKWLYEAGVQTDFKVWDIGQETKGDQQRVMRRWQREGGVMIIGHTFFATQVDNLEKKNKKISDSYNKAVRECLLEGPDIVVIDEGHLIKNHQTRLNRTLCQVRTKRRIILTGTPLQNNLDEYHTMLQFVKPNLLGSLKEFRNRFVNPINAGQHQDSTEHDVRIMKRRAHVLHKLLEGSVQRFDYNILAPYLQPKHEYVVHVQLTDVQIKLYQYYLDNFAREKGNIKGKGYLFNDCSILRLICAHPALLYYLADKHKERNFIREEEAAEDDVEFTASMLANPDWFKSLVPEDQDLDITMSNKFLMMMEIMNECEKIGDKVIVFSQSLDVIDLIEEHLGNIQRSSGHARLVGKYDSKDGLRDSWVKDQDYFVICGDVSAEKRKKYIDKFNDPANLRARLFILSTRAGSLGINLVAANRCIIFDSSWNPTHDVQAIFRIYRFGQMKPTYIYRLVSKGTMEERIYERQVIKEALARRVVDEKQIDRHFNANEIAELYKFQPIMEQKPIPLVPKDRLLADFLLKEPTKTAIVDYHEHDSLLESRPEEDLTEDDRKTAWEEYELEREHKNTQAATFAEAQARFAASQAQNPFHVAGLPIGFQFNAANIALLSSPQFQQLRVQAAASPPIKEQLDQFIREMAVKQLKDSNKAFLATQQAQARLLLQQQQQQRGQPSYATGTPGPSMSNGQATYSRAPPPPQSRPPPAHQPPPRQSQPPPPRSNIKPQKLQPNTGSVLPPYEKMNIHDIFNWCRASDENMPKIEMASKAMEICQKGLDIANHAIQTKTGNLENAKQILRNLTRVKNEVMGLGKNLVAQEEKEIRDATAKAAGRKPVSELIEEVD